MYDDLYILLGEANFCDEKLLNDLKQNINSRNTVALTLSISLTQDQILDCLLKVFDLDLLKIWEMPMFFNYIHNILDS